MSSVSDTKDTSWRALFLSGGVAVAIFIGGTTLQALEAFISTAMLPTVVHDIGGLDLFAWTTTLFIVASILATIFAAVRPGNIGPRGVYVFAACGFGLGSLICGLSPSMPVLLAGRTVQGFGAGLLVSASLAMIRIAFPEHLWSRAMALNAVVWGVATLLGPAIGGIFAQYDLWRWAFLIVVPIAGVLALGAVRILPAREAMQPRAGAPILQIGLVVVAILLISISSLLTDNPLLSGLLLALAVVDVVLLGGIEARARSKLLPRGALAPSTVVGTLFLTILVFNTSISSDIFAPFFLQKVHGLPPLWAGYMTALLATGWVIAAVITSSFRSAGVRRAITGGPVLILAGTIGLALWLGDSTVGPVGLAAIGVSLFAMGFGIGLAFQHLSTSVLASGTEADNDRTSAALGMVQLFAAGSGAAIGGVIVNAAGLPLATDVGGVEHAARWLYWSFALITALAIPLSWRVIRTVPRLVARPAE